MSHRTFFRACALGACLALFGGAGLARNLSLESVSRGQYPTTQYPTTTQEKEPKLSDAEAKAANKVGEAPDAAAKLQAAAEFVKKHPKSAVRRRLAEHVAVHVGNVADSAQRITLIESYLTTFNDPSENDLVTPSLLDAYINASRNEDAFRVGAAWLQKHPEDIDMMRRLTIVASNAAIAGNNAFVAQGQQYGLKAAELMEADKKPAELDAAKWAEYKARHLPAVYREVGVIALRTGDKATARKSMEKAAAHKSSDPVVYLVLSDVANEEYNQLAKQYQAMPAGAEKNAQLKKVEETLDRVIEMYAQTVAISEGIAQYAEPGKEIRKDLESYYKYRHNGSTQGLQELIDKYKKSPASQ